MFSSDDELAIRREADASTISINLTWSAATRADASNECTTCVAQQLHGALVRANSKHVTV